MEQISPAFGSELSVGSSKMNLILCQSYINGASVSGAALGCYIRLL